GKADHICFEHSSQQKLKLEPGTDGAFRQCQHVQRLQADDALVGDPFTGPQVEEAVQQLVRHQLRTEANDGEGQVESGLVEKLRVRGWQVGGPARRLDSRQHLNDSTSFQLLTALLPHVDTVQQL